MHHHHNHHPHADYHESGDLHDDHELYDITPDHGDTHHHHGDDGSTLHHQHNAADGHYHVYYTYLHNVPGKSEPIPRTFGPADHNHDQPTDADDHPTEHVHYWRRTGLILSGNYHYTGFNTYTTERDIVAADSSTTP